MDKLNIPTKIHVGFNNRKNTYTGKLAYIIYTDETGKMRKQTSWESWRNKEIPHEDFDNVPTSGFVLNKGVGGNKSSGYNHRNEWIRVYDPRGFEFEISVANLLFILQECTSVKGKGIDGDFVYAWSGTELVLLPTTCGEYVTSVTFTNAKSKKVEKKDVVPGGIYLNKNLEELVYIGRIRSRKVLRQPYNTEECFSAFCTLKKEPTTFHHIFYNIKTSTFGFEKGFTHLSSRVGIDLYSDYATLHADFITSESVSLFDTGVLVELTQEEATKAFNNSSVVILCNLSTNRYKTVQKVWGDINSTYFDDLNDLFESSNTDGYTEHDLLDIGSNDIHLGWWKRPSIGLRYIYSTNPGTMVDPNYKWYTIKLKLTSGKIIGAPRYA